MRETDPPQQQTKPQGMEGEEEEEGYDSQEEEDDGRLPPLGSAQDPVVREIPVYLSDDLAQQL